MDVDAVSCRLGLGVRCGIYAYDAVSCRRGLGANHLCPCIFSLSRDRVIPVSLHLLSVCLYASLYLDVYAFMHMCEMRAKTKEGSWGAGVHLAHRDAALCDDGIEDKGDAIRHVYAEELLPIQRIDLNALAVDKDAVKGVLPHNAGQVCEINAKTRRADGAEEKSVEAEVEDICDKAAYCVPHNLWDLDEEEGK
jgi:hypothetical protein